MDQWERVAWSDESQFVIHHADGRIRISSRIPGKQLLPECTLEMKWSNRPPCHKAKIVLGWFQEHDAEFPVNVLAA
ncbi:DDE_3 domain-containing protein [Trichonephila clavipes]|nr:DDE_3 domain-containing protein [Trichonephila clavipes]